MASYWPTIGQFNLYCIMSFFGTIISLKKIPEWLQCPCFFVVTLEHFFMFKETKYHNKGKNTGDEIDIHPFIPDPIILGYQRQII